MRIVLVALIALLGLVACDSGSAGGPTGGRFLQFQGEPQVKDISGGIQIDGRVKNTGTQALTGNIGITLFDAAGKIAGTGVASVVRLPAGEEITYTVLVVPKPASWAKVEQKITLEAAI